METSLIGIFHGSNGLVGSVTATDETQHVVVEALDADAEAVKKSQVPDSM